MRIIIPIIGVLIILLMVYIERLNDRGAKSNDVLEIESNWPKIIGAILTIAMLIIFAVLMLMDTDIVK